MSDEPTIQPEQGFQAPEAVQPLNGNRLPGIVRPVRREVVPGYRDLPAPNSDDRKYRPNVSRWDVLRFENTATERIVRNYAGKALIIQTRTFQTTPLLSSSLADPMEILFDDQPEGLRWFPYTYERSNDTAGSSNIVTWRGARLFLNNFGFRRIEIRYPVGPGGARDFDTYLFLTVWTNPIELAWT
jgi:hypothetical protein